MTRGRAAAPDPFDIGAVSRSGEVFEALAARRLAEPGDDPAVRLLAALVADVDRGAPPLPSPAHVSRSKPRRRAVRAVVTLGVTAAVLTTAGAAAAGGGTHGGRDETGARSPRVERSKRTVGHLNVTPSERSAGHHPYAFPEGRTGERHRGESYRPEHVTRSVRERGRTSEHDDRGDVDLSGATPELRQYDAHSSDTPSPEDTTPDTTISVPAIKP